MTTNYAHAWRRPTAHQSTTRRTTPTSVFDEPKRAVAAYNKRAKELDKAPTVLLPTPAASGSASSKSSTGRPCGRPPKGKAWDGAAWVNVSTSSGGQQCIGCRRFGKAKCPVHGHPVTSHGAEDEGSEDEEEEQQEPSRETRTARQMKAVATPLLTPGQVRLGFVKPHDDRTHRRGKDTTPFSHDLASYPPHSGSSQGNLQPYKLYLPTDRVH